MVLDLQVVRPSLYRLNWPGMVIYTESRLVDTWLVVYCTLEGLLVLYLKCPIGYNNILCVKG